MKKLLLSLSVILILTGCRTNVEESGQVNTEDVIPFNANQMDAHNSRNSVDWEGSYSGVLPCDDCRGIETILKINRDQTYELSQRYLDTLDGPSKEVKSEGTFFWNEEGSNITLENIEGDINSFRVGELFLTPLNKNGLEVRPELGNNFKLLKR